MAYKKSSKKCSFCNSLTNAFPGLCHTRGMTVKLQQRQRKRPTQTERGSATRSNVAHPPAYHLDQRIQPREASRSVPIHRGSLGTYGYYPQLDFSYPPRGELSVRSTWLHLSVGKRRFRPQRQRTCALHDAGALACAPQNRAHGQRVCDPQQRGTSVSALLYNCIQQPAASWTAVAERSGDTAFARTAHSRIIKTPRPHHSSFVICIIGRPSPGFVIHLPKCPPVCVIQPVILK